MVRNLSNSDSPTGRTTAPSSVTATRTRPGSRAWWVLAAILVAAFMDYLDVSIVNAAIPTIQRRLDASDTAVQWIAAGYTLPFALGLITGGRLGDVYGRKTVFLTGVAGFTLASAMCGMAVTPQMLIAGRLLQGLSAALMVPQVFAFIQVLFAPRQRARAFTAYAVVTAVASVAGAPVGGLLISADIVRLSWRPVFLLNIVLGVVAFAAVAVLVRDAKPTAPDRLDLGGFALVTVGLLALVLPLVEGPALGWPVWTMVALAAVVPLLAVFARHERDVAAQGRTPLVGTHLFRHRRFVAGIAATLVFFAGVNSFFFVLFLYLQQGLGMTARAAGLIVVIWPLGIAASSTMASRWATGHGRRPVIVGTLVMAASTIATIDVIDHTAGRLAGWELLPSLLATGVGMGLVAPVLMGTILAGVPATEAGAASGLLTSAIQLGASIGVAAAGAIFFALLRAAAVPDQTASARAGTFTGAMVSTLWFHVGAYLVTFVLAFLLPSPREDSTA